jgi:hypothetical protein
MKYSKPQITNTANASLVTMGGQKDPSNVIDNAELQTVGAYSADE